MDGAAGMEVRGPAQHDPFALGGHFAEPVPGLGQAALGFGIERNPAFSVGRRLAPPTLFFDQRLCGRRAVADDLGRPADGGGNGLAADHDDAQVHALDEFLEQDRFAFRLRGSDCGPCGIRRADIDRDPATLFAARRLDHDALVAPQERLDIGIVIRRHGLFRHA